MAKQTRWHYVLVLTNHGPVFVTKIGEHKTAPDCHISIKSP